MHFYYAPASKQVHPGILLQRASQNVKQACTVEVYTEKVLVCSRNARKQCWNTVFWQERKGKERKEKKRKGKERKRKGKERKGTDREGKERKGKDVKGTEGKERNGKART